MNTPLVELRGVCRHYRTGDVIVHALQPIDLAIEKGRFTAVMGASGSGKSTLLNILGLMDPPTSGTFLLDGVNVSELSDAARSAMRCRKIGIIFQAFNLFPHFNVIENVCVPMRFAAHMTRREMRARAEHLLATLGMTHRLRHKANQLSGGESQRVAIARALANNPTLLLADEPTGNLDEKTGDAVIRIFHQLVSSGQTVVMVTHNTNYEAQVDRIVRLHDGSVVAS